jgi:hypothetical protein
MADKFVAQALVHTHADCGARRLELTFTNAAGGQQTISLPAEIAAELAGVLRALAADVSAAARPNLTRMPKQTAVGSARHERLVLIRFDDEPPYALGVSEADNLWRGVREQVEQVALKKTPAYQ